MTALRKTPRMPPVMPRVPKNPVIRNPKARATPPVRADAMCCGGPWHGTRMTVRANEPTIVFSLHGCRGRYVPSGQYQPFTGKHHTLRASEYTWEPV